MTITHAVTVSLPVTDLDLAKAFYVDTLGFEVIADQQVGPVRWLQVAPTGAQTGFTLVTAEQGFTPGSAKGIIVETTDLDADCAQFIAVGAAVEGPADLPWGRQATLRDPDGNSFVLATPIPSDTTTWTGA